MKIFQLYKQLLKRSPAARIISIAAVILIALGLTAIIGKKANRKPVITSINPTLGSPGDIMTIKGNSFGSARGTSYVEIAGSRITAQGYIKWTNTEIEILLPASVQDGLVFIGTAAGRSEPEFFANESSIPVAIRADPTTTFPVISSISPASATVGDIITIKGSNFGSSRGESLVYFTANKENTATYDPTSGGIQTADVTFINATTFDFDYVFWSDSEIQVRVPDGADSGSVYVATNKGNSLSQKINVTFAKGKKKYSNMRTYVVTQTADISSNTPGQNSAISLYIPKPPVSSFQPSAQMTDYYPEPLIIDDDFDMIHQKQISGAAGSKQRFSQTFVISVNSISSNIRSATIAPYAKTDSTFYKTYTAPDSCIPSENQTIKNLAQTITGSERNPLTKARLIYDYILTHYKILDNVRSGDVSPLDILKQRRGDAYDFAILYTSLCRASGIPCVPVSGVLIENNSVSRVHWWTELYFEGYGWFPVDIALAAGINFTTFIPVNDSKEFYFGSLDNQHVAYSRGWKQIKPSLINGKSVYRPRTYALQSIWEESADQNLNYSSLWNDPVIIGIY